MGICLLLYILWADLYVHDAFSLTLHFRMYVSLKLLRLTNSIELGTLKFAILIFYRRLKADEWRQTSLTINRLILINVVAYLALVLTALFSCWP